MSNVEETLAWLDRYGIEGEPSGEEFKTLCPYHADTDPSCGINLEKRVFRCYACQARGDLVSFLATKMRVSRATIQKELGLAKSGAELADSVSLDLVAIWHRALVESKRWLHELKRLKGITLETVQRYTLGLEDNRITIPIISQTGKVVNVRKWSPDPKLRSKKMISIKDDDAALYPMDWQSSPEVVVCEGELKALLMRQMGFVAISPTGGAGTWHEGWNGGFADKVVHVLYDIDKAGKIGANKVARNVHPVARSVHIVRLPMNEAEVPHGDITDFVVNLGHGADEVRELIRTAAPWEPQTLKDDVDTSTVHKLHLAQTSQGKWCNKLVEADVVVSAKDTAPYLVPREFEVACSKDLDVCTFCPVFNAKPKDDQKPRFQIDCRDSILLEMVDVNKRKVLECMKRAAGIPKQCQVCAFKPTKVQNVEEVRLIPQLSISTKESEHVVRRAFYVGHGIETNTQYTVHARVLPEPNTQYATLVVYEAKASVDSLSEFKLDDDAKERLRRFQPAEWTQAAIEAKMEELYADLEANVTMIYGRRDMHLFYDLIYHSVLYVPFQGKLQKGWCEGLVLGDSGQGKSETIKYLMKHYGLGEKIDSKGATVAGLLGGLQETSNRWFVSWGVITLNDRRLVVLEEVKGMPAEVIARLTDMRSSGIAEIPKIEKARANARCRLVWISNPRSDRQVLSYNYGVEAIKELVGALEDVRRFDMAIVVASGEVDKRYLNLQDKDRPKREHRFVAGACRDLILWAWSRLPDCIEIAPETERRILEQASRMAERYTSRIPLVEAADQRIKLARLAAAMAARTFSTDDGQTLKVRPCHVDAVVAFLDRLYSSQACGYAQYSALVKNEDKLHDEEEIREAVAALPHAKDAVRALLDAPGFSSFDLVDWTGMDSDKARELVGLLVRKNALKRGRKAYVKTPAFIVLLKTMQMEGKLENASAYDQSKKEEF